ncbi:putative FMN-dependent luciferase-like monooxygenase [Frondihabitans cladoniiphilus]|uniref:FMN-dependent luciferase-like monooxygenase n=1 Tax=Frondihabitans cladoniiphilus TaxID=715785 RepID=A0ABP8VN99_9MICO
MTSKRLGFFTRVLDDAPPAERYRLAVEQIRHAEELGFTSAWVAQHHFNRDEGGMPSPFVFLGHVAAVTSRIRLATGILTLPLENPVRAAEDASVLDALSGGRLDVGVGSGGTATAFPAFGEESDERGAVFAQHLRLLKRAWAGDSLPGGNHLYPAGLPLADRVWQATFSESGGQRAGAAGDGLLLSRTQPRTGERPDATLAELQTPIVEAYLAALPAGRTPRILGSRSVFVADDRSDALRFATIGLTRAAEHLAASGRPPVGRTVDELIAEFDVHVGTPDDVIASLAADTSLEHATDVAFQVHSVDPPHEFVLRSLELAATRVAPALGWAIDAPLLTTSLSEPERSRA